MKEEKYYKRSDFTCDPRVTFAILLLREGGCGIDKL